MQNSKKIILLTCLAFSAMYIHAQTLYTSASASIYISGAANIDGNISTTPTLYVAGAVQNNGTLTNAGEMQQTGNLNNPGTFASSGDNVFLTGAVQNLSGGFTGAESFYNVILNKSVNPVVLSTDVEVANQVNLVNGKISVGSLNLTLAPTATIVGYDANDYIFTGITGRLHQTVGASNVVFPVGAGTYNPITLSNTGTSDVFSVRVANSVVCNGSNTLASTAKVNRMWYINEAVAGGSDATITTQWNTSDEQAGFARATSGIIPLNGTSFDLSSATNTAATSVIANVWSQSKSNQTTISPVIVTSLVALSPTSPTTFCNGSSINLIAPSDPDFSYIWSEGGNVIVPSASNATYIANASGIYSVDITSTGGCKVATPSIELALPSAPTITSSAGVSGITRCAGTSLTLTGPAAAEYAWFKNGTFVKYDVAPNNTYTPTLSGGTTNYSLVAIYSGVCPSAASANFTVIGDEPPAVITPSTMPPYCVNTVPTLNANTGVGYTYSWVGTSPSAATATSSAFTPTTSGNHRVVVTNTNGCSKTSAWMNIALNGIPAVYPGTNQATCVNNSVNIGAVATAGLSYSWTPSTHLSSATASKPTVMPTATGTIHYNLTVTNAVGCKNTGTVSVTTTAQPATPSLSGTASPVCQGTSITLTPSGVTGAVNWYKGSLLNLSASTNAARTLATVNTITENYTIRAKVGTCLSEPSSPVSVWIRPAPTPTLSATPAIVGNVVSVCNPGQTSGTAQLMVNLPSGAPTATYNWQQVVSGVATNVSPAATASTYTAAISTTANNKNFRSEVTYSNGCVKNTSNVTVKMLPSTCTARAGQAADLTEEIFTAYPNPTQGVINVSITNSPASEGELALYNTLGQVVISRTITLSNGASEENLDLSGLASGVYTLSFQTKDGNQVQKIVKE